MRGSDLRRRLLIERAVDVADEAGGRERAFVVEAGVFAHVEAVRAREAVEGGRLAGVVTHKITLRWRDDIHGSVRFVDGAARYAVLAHEPLDQDRRFLVCLCEEEEA